MKKVLATVAALGLVAGFAANALALDKPGTAAEGETTTAPRVPAPTAPGVALWSVAGQWVLAGAYLSNGLGAGGGAAVNDQSDGNDAFYIYSFKILPVLQVNDKISMKGELRIADRSILGGDDIYGSNPQDKDAHYYHVYMEWISPLGKTRFGRTPAGAWGSSKWNNSSRQGNRLMWWLNMLPDNWGSLIFTEKLAENDEWFAAAETYFHAGELNLQAGAEDAARDSFYHAAEIHLGIAEDLLTEDRIEEAHR
ncbi:MAG: hypothetical protein R3297_08285, partial [Desulfobulbales bacterium]|nr:hypothetical protein [Desulfobulbales bacterium]